MQKGHGLMTQRSGQKFATTECSSFVGASIWEMVRSASLQIDPAILRLACIDADYSMSDMNRLKQVLHELRGIADSKVLELEVSYRGNVRFVQRLRKREYHDIGDVELTLSSRGSLENLVVSPFNGHPQLIPNNSVEVDMQAVGLNPKDVLNVLVPVDAAYLGFDDPPPSCI